MRYRLSFIVVLVAGSSWLMKVFSSASTSASERGVPGCNEGHHKFSNTKYSSEGTLMMEVRTE